MSMKSPFLACCPLILASNSPRRRDFFCQLGLDFSVISAHVDETPLPAENPDDFVRRLALAKAAAVAQDHPQSAVVGADTVVVAGGAILGKPADEAHAAEMIFELAGKWHEVWTGYAVLPPGGKQGVSEAVCTRVRFAPLSREICRAYAASGDGLDKAGAYGIQSGGAFLVEEIAGSHSNVIGLPMSQLLSTLLQLAILRPA